jgi:hypothetical protein
MRIHPFAAIAAFVLATPLLLSGCDAACDPGHPSILCPSDLSGSSAGVCPSGGDVYALGLSPSWTPHPLGWINPQPTTAARQLLYGCGQAVCAASAAAAAEAFADAIGVSSTEGLFVVDLGSTGPQIQANEPVAAAQWLAAGSPCYDGPTCDPCDDGEGGTLQNVGEYCNTGEGMAPAPGGSQCCAGLSCTSTGTLAGTCQGTLAPCPQAQPNWVGLDTGTLRNICINNNVNGSASQSGITLNRTCGVAFETWVLKTMGWLPRWTTLIDSPARQAKTGGLPGSVIPEQVLDQSSFMSWVKFPQSVLVEVKAVNGTLTLGTSQWQILGLLNVAQIAQAPAGPHAPPAVFFITTSNTAISTTPLQVVDQATMWKVAVWQQIVYYDANGGTNPNLSVGDPTSPSPTCLNDSVYGPVKYTIWPGPGPQNPLTWATDQEQDAVGAVPDPDSPAVVP